MSTRRRELVATDESTVISKPFLDSIVVEDREGNECFPDPPCADESDRFELFCVPNDLLDKLATAKTGPGRWRRQLSRENTMQA